MSKEVLFNGIAGLMLMLKVGQWSRGKVIWSNTEMSPV